MSPHAVNAMRPADPARATDTAAPAVVDSVASADADRLDADRPDATRVDLARPDATGADADQPVVDGLDADRPDATRLDAARPDATGVDADQPVADGLDADRPDATRVDAARPDATGVDAGQPVADGADVGAELRRVRDEIERIDRGIVGMIAERVALARQVGPLKQALGMPILDPPREAAIVRRAGELARAAGLADEDVRYVFWHLVGLSRRVQLEEG